MRGNGGLMKERRERKREGFVPVFAPYKILKKKTKEWLKKDTVLRRVVACVYGTFLSWRI